MTHEKSECCPTFDPKRWDEKTHTWEEKRFIMDSVPTLFHIPFPPMIGKRITRMWAMARASNAASNKSCVRPWLLR